jgi:hypothetical protein
VESLLDRHLLAGLLAAPWVCTADPEILDDRKFNGALQELTAYAFEEARRIKVRKPGHLFRSWLDIPARSSNGILEEIQSLLRKYRQELISQSSLLDRREPR